MILTVTATAVVIALASYTGLSAAVAQRFTTAQRKSPLAGPTDDATACAPPSAVRFQARDGRASIAAWYQPAAESRGAVVFVHGKDACRGDELKASTFALAKAFAEAGLAVLMIDLRGHGHSSGARLTYGEHERFDVLGAVDWLRAQGHRRIGVLGASMGAAASLMAAADEPAIAALVVDSAFADFGLMIERQYARLSRLPGFVLPGALAIARVLTGVTLQRVCPLQAAAALAGRPCLVIHSAGDRFVPAGDAQALAQAARGELWITDNDGHIGSYRAGPAAYAARVLGFFRRHLIDEWVPLRLSARAADTAPTTSASACAVSTGQVLACQT